MKAKLRQMQAARNLDLNQLQEQLASNVAKVQQHEEHLEAAEARLQGSMAEMQELRSSAEDMAQLRSNSEEQQSLLRSKLEQAYADKAQLETAMVDLRHAETEAKAAREQQFREELCKAESSASAMHSRCMDLQVEVSTLREKEVLLFTETEESAEAQERSQKDMEDLKTELKAALAAAQKAEKVAEEVKRERRDMQVEHEVEREELRTHLADLEAAPTDAPSKCCTVQ